MKLRNKKSLKIAAATSGTVFSLVAVFVATYAWFVANAHVGADGLVIKGSDLTGRLNKIELYEIISTDPLVSYDEDDNEILTPNYSFSSTPSATLNYDWDDENQNSIENFYLGDYNPLSTEHPLLLIFSFNAEYTSTAEEDVYIKGSSHADDFLGETVNGAPKYNLGSEAPTLLEKHDTTTGLDYYPLSSVVNFRCLHFSADDYDDLLDNSQEGRIDINPDDLILKECFVNFVPASESIEFIQNPTIYSSPGNDTPIYCIAMVVNYDSDAITAIYSTYLGDSTLDNDYEGELHFTCDWILEVF